MLIYDETEQNGDINMFYLLKVAENCIFLILLSYSLWAASFSGLTLMHILSIPYFLTCNISMFCSIYVISIMESDNIRNSMI